MTIGPLELVRRAAIIREPARWVATRLTRYRPDYSPDVAILASRRSGSTWLMEILAAERGVTFVNEPFHPSMVGHPLATGMEGLLPDPECKVVAVPPDLEQVYRRHVTDFDETRIRGPYNPLSPHFEYSAQRRVMKIVHATAISDWLVESFPRLRCIYLIRHPIPSALSLMRNCLPRARAHLVSDRFREAQLSPELAALSTRILEHGSELERWTLEWCLDNIVPWRTFIEQGKDGLVVSYEELLLEPASTVQRIAAFAGLDLTDRAAKQVDQLSASADSKKGRMDPEARLEQLGLWRKGVSRSEEEAAFAIVSEFGIDAYAVGELLPTSKHFAHVEVIPTAGGPAERSAKLTAQEAVPNAPATKRKPAGERRTGRGRNLWFRGRVRNSWHWKIRNVLSRSPVFLAAARWKYRGEPPPDQWATTHVLNSQSQILIEGFPRSGNTFAVVAFQDAQPDWVRIANHLHAPSHVRAAVREGIPALVLIRNPDQAVTSFTIFTDFGVDPKGALESYISFYRKILPFAGGFVSATFGTVIRDFGSVIQRVNVRFGTDFALFDGTDESVRRCFDRIEQENARMHGGRTREQGIARPSEVRAQLKQLVQEKLDHPSLAELRATAWEYYERFRVLESPGAE